MGECFLQRKNVMSNDTELARLWSLQAKVDMMILDGRRTPSVLADALQKILEEKQEKFALLADLGILTVPDGYVHEKWLAGFCKQNRKKFYYYNDDIADKNFPNPTRILKPGDKLRVRAFMQVAAGTTTSKERMAFLATQKAIHTGAQGASLVFVQKRDLLPKGKWYSSFDESDRLWKDTDGDLRVPGVSAYAAGDFDFYLGYFEYDWDGGYAFLCFCDE